MLTDPCGRCDACGVERYLRRACAHLDAEYIRRAEAIAADDPALHDKVDALVTQRDLEVRTVRRVLAVHCPNRVIHEVA